MQRFCLPPPLQKTSSRLCISTFQPLLLIPVLMLCLQLEQLYSLSLCSREDCLRVLSKYQWNLQMASRYLIRWSRDERPTPADRERPQVSAERRVWSFAGWFWTHGWLTAARCWLSLTQTDSGDYRLRLEVGTEWKNEDSFCEKHLTERKTVFTFLTRCHPTLVLFANSFVF